MPFHLTGEGISQSQTARIHLKISPLSGLLCLTCIMYFFLDVGLAVQLVRLRLCLCRKAIQ